MGRWVAEVFRIMEVNNISLSLYYWAAHFSLGLMATQFIRLPLVMGSDNLESRR